MTNSNQIQTVHGITHPVVVQFAESQPTETDEPPAPQHDREASKQRLEQRQRLEKSLKEVDANKETTDR